MEIFLSFKASKMKRNVEMLTSELSSTQDRSKKQTEELSQLQEQVVALKVEQATLQEKCRLALEEVKNFGLCFIILNVYHNHHRDLKKVNHNTASKLTVSLFLSF